MNIPDCKHFSGYKPCFPGTNCLRDGCIDPQPIGTKILIINLDAMGNVLVTTSLLPAIKRKYPVSSISWITMPNVYPLLSGNPLIDRIYKWEPQSWMMLRAMDFDVVMNFDKSVQTGAFINSLHAIQKLGYGITETGVIIPLNEEAEYNYQLGLDDYCKFRINQKPNPQLLAEAVGIEYGRDEYNLQLTPEELTYCEEYKREVHIKPGALTVGFNTGCSLLYPNKKMTIDQHIVLIEMLAKTGNINLVLLGGPEDTERNAEIKRRTGDRVVNTPTMNSVRKGVCYENICDVIITGDSFGMHVAIALKKFVIVWFGVSCPQEIDLFDRGVKLIPEGLECSPCWKKECPYGTECIQMVDLERMVEEVNTFKRATL
ncbi:MAG: glycosyltransferase family 9 protein [Bacteroidota bacterium]